VTTKEEAEMMWGHEPRNMKTTKCQGKEFPLQSSQETSHFSLPILDF
jgi:hypothetical protein